MKKTYEIILQRVEVPYKKCDKSGLHAGMSFDYPYDRDVEPEVQEVFESLEEAREAFAEYSASISYLSGWAAPFWLIEEYAIEECHYDEDGDRICDPGDGDYHDLKTLVFDVYEIDEDDFPIGDRLARFNSYAEAEAWAKANGNDELRLEVVF